MIPWQQEARYHGEKTRRRVRFKVFETYAGDHLPLHVHISRNGREIGRWDIEHQRPMDPFVVGKRLRQALRQLGYLLEDNDHDGDRN